MTDEIAAVCLGWRYFRHWVPAPAFAGVTFFRRNDGVVGGGRVVRQAHHERKEFMPLLSDACPLPTLTYCCQRKGGWRSGRRGFLLPGRWLISDR